MPADDTALPALFTPLLEYLSSILPPQLYAATALLLAQCYTLIASLLSLFGALFSSSTSTSGAPWDMQTILPPLITLFAAYLALLSFYRTAGWMLRLGFAFVKWGFVLTTLGAAAGYILANGHPDGRGVVMFGQGLLPSLGGMFLDMFDDGKQSANANSNSKSGSTSPSGGRSGRSGRSGKGKPRPKAWEAWEKQYEWKYEQTTHTEGASVQQVIRDILGSASTFVQESGWWDVAKGAYDKATSAQAGLKDERGEGKGKEGKGKSRTR